MYNRILYANISNYAFKLLYINKYIETFVF